jgi:putative oxidoreductase
MNTIIASHHVPERPAGVTGNVADLAGRGLLSALFLVAGIGKISGYAGTQAYMQTIGVPGELLPLVIALELGGGLALLAGFQTRAVALALGIFSVLCAVMFHNNLADQTQFIMFFKNLSIAGGMLAVAARPAGHWTIDALRRPA